MRNQNRDSATDGDAVFMARARAMAGEGAPAEREAFGRELHADPRRAELFAALDGALRPLSAARPAAVDTEAALARVLSRRDARPVLVADAPARPPRVGAPPSAARPDGWRGAG